MAHTYHRLCGIFGLVALLLGGLAALPTVPNADALAPGNGQPAHLVLGQSDFTSSGVPTPPDTMSSPSGVAVDPTSGKVFVVDRSANRVMRFSSSAALSNGAEAEAMLGQPNLTSTSRGCAQNRLSVPAAIALDSSGRLWVADGYNHRVLRFDAAASKPNGANADGVLGQPDFTHCYPVTSQNGMADPSGIAIDSSGRVWVADSYNHRVLRFDAAAAKPNGANADAVLGQPDFTSKATARTQSGLNTPTGIAIDGSGRVWVADEDNHRVLRFDVAAAKPNGANADGVLGQPDFTQGLSGTLQSGLRYPMAVTTDSGGRVWVADRDNHRVLRFDAAASKPNGANADGVLGQPDFTSKAPAITQSGMYAPTGIAIDSSGRVWVADGYNARVLRFDGAASKPNGANADGVLGQPNFTSRIRKATNYGMGSPESSAIDPVSGKVFVADSGDNRILRFASIAALSNGAPAEAVLGQSGMTSTSAGLAADRLDIPVALAFDSDGRLWVADRWNDRVLRFDGAASKPNGANADGVLGQPDFTSWGLHTTQNGMFLPTGIATDSSGRLWVADGYNARVLRFDGAASKPNGANADGVLGQPDFISRAWQTTQSGLSVPTGIATDSSGRLWVADRYNSRVLRFDGAASKPNGANADGVLGQPDFISRAWQTTQSGLDVPTGITTDSSGGLWVADEWNNRVLYFAAAAAKPNGANADGVLGQPDFTGWGSQTTGDGLAFPQGVAYDPVADAVWVADTDNNRVLAYRQIAYVAPPVYLPLVAASADTPVIMGAHQP